MSDEKKLPEFPGQLPDGYSETVHFWMDRERAITAYWEARCRLAVEALKHLDGFFPDLDDKGTVFIRNTLSTIGELPSE